MFWISLQPLPETFFILRRNERNLIENVYRSSRQDPLFLSDCNWTWIFFDRFSKKYSNIKFHENPSSGSRVVPCGRTNRYDEANGRFHATQTRLKAVFSNRSQSEKAETYSSTSTIFYPTTRIATSLTLFRVMAGIATFAAIPVYGEPGSTPFTAAYYSSYQHDTQCIWRQHCKCFPWARRHASFLTNVLFDARTDFIIKRADSKWRATVVRQNNVTILFLASSGLLHDVISRQGFAL